MAATVAHPASADAVVQPEGFIVEPDEGNDGTSDVDSALGDDRASSTDSLTSSVLNYEYENGRRYHAFRSGQYFLPNDEAEQDRLDLTHHILSLLLGGDLFKAPITEPKRILDIGTGTGIWAIDIADTFPAAEVIATDLSPIQPKWIPPNLEFQVDDAEADRWSFSKPFDYIHLRNLGGSIADWPKLIKNVYDNLAPGGYIEAVDWETYSRTDDDSLPADSAMAQWQRELNEAAEKSGREMRTAIKLKGWVEGAGFETVTEEVLKASLSDLTDATTDLLQ